ncbi:hypothetical protein C8T65DRAFT_650095, partial [Cerioporus squamosus]
MDTEQHEALNKSSHIAHVDEPQALPANVATKSTTATAESPRQHEPPCHCWKGNRMPKDTRVAQTPAALGLVLPQIRGRLERSVQAFVHLVHLAEKIAAALEDTTALLPPDICDDLCLRREVVASGFDAATVTIITTPGYVCKEGSAEHERRYSERHKALTNIEDELTRGIKDAESLFDARDELVLAERRYRHRKYIQAAFRTMSILTIPYSPLVSAIFTAGDLFGVSVLIAIQRAVFPDAGEQLGETLDRVMSLERNIQRKVEEVRRLKDALAAVKAKLEEEQRHPIATQLAGILDKVYLAKLAVESVIFAPCAKCTCPPPALPVREVVVALRVMTETLDSPEGLQLVDEQLASLSEERCAVLDRLFAVLRTVVSTSCSASLTL